MKMLCIRGRLHPAHTGLYAGRVYEVNFAQWCCAGEPSRAFAEGSFFIRRVRLICRVCGQKRSYQGLVAWGPDRFIPFDPVKTIERMGRTATRKTPRRTPVPVDNLNGYEVDKTIKGYLS